MLKKDTEKSNIKVLIVSKSKNKYDIRLSL